MFTVPAAWEFTPIPYHSNTSSQEDLRAREPARERVKDSDDRGSGLLTVGVMCVAILVDFIQQVAGDSGCGVPSTVDG